MKRWEQMTLTEQTNEVKELFTDIASDGVQHIPGGLVDQPGFDYDVLHFARMELHSHDLQLFGILLHSRMSSRVKDGELKALGYRPGDYSYCFWMVLNRN